MKYKQKNVFYSQNMQIKECWFIIYMNHGEIVEDNFATEHPSKNTIKIRGY